MTGIPDVPDTVSLIDRHIQYTMECPEEFGRFLIKLLGTMECPEESGHKANQSNQIVGPLRSLGLTSVRPKHAGTSVLSGIPDVPDTLSLIDRRIQYTMECLEESGRFLCIGGFDRLLCRDENRIHALAL
jgi:hypothetical protein